MTTIFLVCRPIDALQAADYMRQDSFFIVGRDDQIEPQLPHGSRRRGQCRRKNSQQEQVQACRYRRNGN
jgi:hypothetical protein